MSECVSGTHPLEPLLRPRLLRCPHALCKWFMCVMADVRGRGCGWGGGTWVSVKRNLDLLPNALETQV